MTRRLALLLQCLCLPAPVLAGTDTLAEGRLWMERYFWDGLLHARTRAARVSADPALLKAVELIAHQAAQQAVNLQQIQLYAKTQTDNLRYAFTQQDPKPSLLIIQNNMHTLAKGTEQVRNNLYYLTTRVRLCSSQALPDPKLTQTATLLIAQIQNIQLALNTLYLDSVSVQNAVRSETWAVSEFFRYSSEHLLRSVVNVQDSVFSVYNASYELYILSK